MNTAVELSSALSARLKRDTNDQHELMHRLMEQGQPFASRTQYARFVCAQYVFQRDVEYLFADPSLQAAVADLAVRGRQAAALADLADLGVAMPPPALASLDVRMPAALGWLYVSEGSTLGAAFLFKEARERLGLSAEFGARNLAAYPEGRALVWRRFVASLDSDALDAAAQQQVIDGAHAAYRRFGALLQQYFELD